MVKRNDRWSALSLKDRADLMNVYITNGISDLKEMKKHYNGVPYRDLNTSDYDYFNAHPSNAPVEEGEHWTSRNPKTGRLLKREDHPTFDLMIEKEKQAGYKIIRGYNDELYSVPNEPTNYVEDYNSFRDGGRVLDGTSEENQTLSNNSVWKTIGSTAYDVLELIDPTGITSWATPEGDLWQAIEGYRQGENGFGKVALEAVGAIPLLGKVGKAVKLTKGLSNADKVLNTARKAFKNAEQVDTFLELIPGVKKAASATQGFTGTLLQGAADAMNLSSNARHYTNIGTVLLNNANTIKDVIDVFNLDRNTQPLLDNPYTRTEYMSYWDASKADKNFLPASKGRYDIFSKKNETDAHTHYDVIEARYKRLIPIMKEKGFNPEEINRLSPFLITQMILEGGWNISNENNNFGGMLDPKTRKKIKFDSEEEFYRTYLDTLDKRWGDEYLGKGKGWRNAKDLKHYADIVNREDLRLHTKEAWEEYNRTHPKTPAYIYTPLWENNNTGLMSEAKFGGIEGRVSGLIDLLRLRESTWDKYARNHNILKEIK